MFSFQASNIHEALQMGLEYLLHEGVEEDSRNGKVLVAPGPVCTEYTAPRNRVLFSPTRDANPVFHFHEALWILSGSNDVMFVEYFAKNMRAYSDDGATSWGAYGWRARKFYGWDQLEAIIAELKANPTSRRCVLGLWNTMGDYEGPLPKTGMCTYNDHDIHPDFDVAKHGGLDVPCLAGETVLQSPEGAATLRELAAQFKSGEVTRWPVLSVDTKSKLQSLVWCTKVWKSGRKKLYAIKFDDGSIVRATADHKFFKKMYRNNVFCEEVETQALRPGDRVWAAGWYETSKGYLVYTPDLGVKGGFGNEGKIHRDYYALCEGAVPAGHVIHHDDEIKLHNYRNNLIDMTESAHNRLHRLGDRNPMRRLTPQQHARRATKQAAALRTNWATRSDEEKATHSENTSKGLVTSWAMLSQEERVDRVKLSPTKQAEKSKKLSRIKKEYWQNKRNALKNHVVVSITPCGVEDVYDFEVPENHTSILSNGVLVHNCNTQAYFDCRSGKVNMTVCNRSNDAIWGCYGANAVHFSFLLEYMAFRVGLPIGVYRQFSNNFHAYLDVFSREKMERIITDCYEELDRESTPTGPGMEPGFDEDLTAFMQWARKVIMNSHGMTIPAWKTKFFSSVAEPMFMAWRIRKNALSGQTDVSLDGRTVEGELARISAPDWRRACEEWILRRKK